MTSGQIFAEDGPGGVFVASGVVCADELPFGGAAPVTGGAACGVMTRSEGDAAGDDGRFEFIPNQVREWDGILAGTVGIPSAVPKAVDIVSEGLGWSVGGGVRVVRRCSGGAAGDIHLF